MYVNSGDILLRNRVVEIHQFQFTKNEGEEIYMFFGFLLGEL